MRVVTVLLLLALLSGQTPDFNVQSKLVIVPAMVTDEKGRVVEGLDALDFIVTDSGQVQRTTVDVFATGVASIALMVVVQSSGISAAVLEKVRKIGAMVHPLITGDRGCAGLVSFAERVTWLQECTNNVATFSRSFEKLRAGEATAGKMLDAVDSAVLRLSRRPNSRRVLLLISESRDRGSEMELETVLMNAQAAGVTVYAANYSAFLSAFTSKSSATAPPRPKRNTRLSETGTITGGQPTTTHPALSSPEQRLDLLGWFREIGRLDNTKTTEALAVSTGGATYSFARLKGLEDAIEKLGSELHSQYVLSFAPASPALGYHRLEVRVPARPELKVRARPGYWTAAAPPKPEPPK